MVLRKYHYSLIFIQFTFFVLKSISWSSLSYGEQCPYPEKNLKYTVKLKIYGQYLFNFKNYACVLFWNDVHCKGYIIDYTLFNMCDVHVQVFRHTDIYYSQCFDLIFASSVFVPQTFKIKTLLFYSVFLTFRQISDMNWLFKVKLPIMVNWLFLFCVYFIVVVVFYLLLVVFLN